MKRVLLGNLLLGFMLLIQAACVPPNVLYLTPGRYLEPVSSGQSGAMIMLERFSESFSEDELLGRHKIGRRDQLLRVNAGLVADTMDAFLGDAFINSQHHFSRGSGWDQKLTGLQRYEGRAAAVVSGNISKFTVNVKTGLTRLTSNLDISMDVDCLIGLPREGKIVRKTVHMNEKVLKFSANQKAIEKVVDSFLSAVSEEILKNIEDSLP